MAARIRKGDRVQVMTGADRGKRGEVLQVMPKENRAVVQGVNIAKRHKKAQGMGQEGGIIAKEATIHLSNIMLIDPVTDKPTRIAHRVLDNGTKLRVARRTGNTIES
jgi:large subunit ribosomal protein L24